MDDKNIDNGSPFMPWVGSKRKLASQLSAYVPKNLNNYYEPFLGAGALFFEVKKKFKHCFLSDVNFDLIASFNMIKKYPSKTQALLFEHENNHSKEYYNDIKTNDLSNDPIIKAARFLYLNRHSFKGMYKMNKSGELSLLCSDKIYPNFNVLYERIANASLYLNNTSIFVSDFSFIEPSKDDFVYLDPPYHKSGERFYTRLPFNECEQIRLSHFVNDLNNKGVKFMLSNSNTQFIKTLYQDFDILNIEVNYNIKEKRTTNNELLITNYKL
jgi:DNA adenine methylase